MAANIALTLGANIGVAQAEGNDPYFQLEGGVSLTMLPPVYNLDDYSITVNVAVIDDDDVNPESFTVNSVAVTNNYPDDDIMVYTTTSNSYTFVTGTDSPFDDYFTFMYYGEDGEFAYRDDWSPSDAIANGFKAIVKWQHPSVILVPVTHSISVTATGSRGTAFSGTESISGNLYFKYPPYTEFVVNLSQNTTDVQDIIVGMIGVLVSDEYNYYVDDEGNILEYFVAEEEFEGIAIGETYILDGDVKVRFDPPDYLGNGADFTENGTNLEPAKNVLISLGLYEEETP